MSLDRSKFELVYDGDPQVSVFRNNRALPRASVVYGAGVVADKGEAATAIHRQGFDPTRKVVVEGGQPVAFNLPSSEVKFLRYSANEMALKVAASAPAYLLLSEVYYDGWKAWIDGRPEKVLRANYLFRAVPLAAGDHEVRLVFDPPSFRMGATISGLTWIGLAAGVIQIMLGRRSQD